MTKSEEKALRAEASALLRAMNKVTGTSAAEMARRIGLHKGNISAFVNQSRVELLGWATIANLLRMYGFEFRDNSIRVRPSESCPVITYPVTDEVTSGLHELAMQMRQLGMPCTYRPFQIGSDTQGLEPYLSGGLLFASDGQNIWTAISLDRDSALSECARTEAELAMGPEILLHEDQFEGWRDSAPHRHEVVCYLGGSAATAEVVVGL